MDPIELFFQKPALLNEVDEPATTERPPWHHLPCNSAGAGPLSLNIGDWTIHCPSCGKSALICHWDVDETACLMKTSDEVGEGDFNSLDYPFSVSMLGQVLQRTDLIQYLKQLQNLYALQKDRRDLPEGKDSDNATGDPGDDTDAPDSDVPEEPKDNNT